MKTPRTEQLLNILQGGQELTVAQIRKKIGFPTNGSIRAAVQNLRKKGYAIYANKKSTGVITYRLGTPTRKVVAAGFALLGASAYTR